MFVVTGITGQVGGAVARRLLARRLPVRAVVRSAEKGAPWAAKGCAIAIADMNDAASLTAAFAGAEGVFAVLPPMFDPADGFPEIRAMVAALRTALAAAAPGKVVCLSTVGAQATEPNLLGQLAIMEQELGRLDMPVAFLRAAWFMENFAWDIDSARDRGVIESFLQPLDRRIPMIATDDLGQEAAQLLTETWQGRRIVEIAGPTDLSPDDVAAVLADLLGRPVMARAVPRDSWRDRFLADGMTNPTPRIRMLDGFNEGWISFEGRGTESRRGTTTLAEVLAPKLGTPAPST